MTEIQSDFKLDRVAEQVERVVLEVLAQGPAHPSKILVVGVSTSEVIGRHIGSSGSSDVAAQILEGVRRARAKVTFSPAFQCCEHLNRALVVERELVKRQPQLELVSVVPVPQAGGAMAAYAYKHLQDAVVVEAVVAHAGIDIGETMIGMHVKRVAVPFRPSIRQIGLARVLAAYSRPKLIGGARAVYTEGLDVSDRMEPSNSTLSCD